MSVILTDKIQPRTTGIALTVVGDTNVSGALTCTNFTASGDVSIGGTLTYEDVTNIDSVGLITARTGVRVTAGGVVVTAGVSTFTDDVKVNSTLTATEGLNVTAGIVTVNDYIQHAGDTNTAIRFPSADTITAETGGSERLRITSAGLVGIGQATPEGLLHLEASSSGASYTADAADTLILERNGGCVIDFRTPAANDSGLIFSDADARAQGSILYNHNGNTLALATNGGERLRITSDGKVGINSVPGYTLDMIGDQIRLRSNASGSNAVLRLWGQDASSGGAVISQNNTGGAAPLYFYYSNSDLGMKIDSSGRVLMGTTTEGNESADELTVSNSGNTGITIRSTDSSNCSLFFSDATSGASEYTGYVQYLHSNNSLKFGTATTERLVIDSDGGMELTPSKNSGNNGFTVTPANGTTASSFQVLANNNAGADGRNGCATFIDVNYYASTSTIFNLAGRGTNLLAVLGNGNVNIGGAAVSQSRNVNIASNSEANLAIETHNDSTSETSNIRFYKSGNTGASPQIVEADDNLAQIMVYGHDGTDYANQAAGIRFNVDGTPGSNDMPGEIQFLTNNGTGGVGNRFNISAIGNIGWAGGSDSSSAVQQRKRFSSISHSANTTYDVNICEDFGNDDMIKLEYAFNWNAGDGGAWGTAIAWKQYNGTTTVRYLGEEVASPVSSFVLAFDGNTVKARIAYGGSGMNGRRMLNVECGGQCTPAAF